MYGGGAIEPDVVSARRGRRPIVLLALGLAVAAPAVWVLGIVGIGQFGEDICLDHPPAEATGYQSEGSVWPPRLTCLYDTREGDTLEVDHRLYPAIAAAWLIGFPTVAAVGIGVGAIPLTFRSKTFVSVGNTLAHGAAHTNVSPSQHGCHTLSADLRPVRCDRLRALHAAAAGAGVPVPRDPRMWWNVDSEVWTSGLEGGGLDR